jgi:hypothetical protein
MQFFKKAQPSSAATTQARIDHIVNVEWPAANMACQTAEDAEEDARARTIGPLLTPSVQPWKLSFENSVTGSPVS